jgi:hypothetical protein
LKHLLKITNLDESLVQIIPLSDQELQDYNTRTLNCIKITPEDFQLDISWALGCSFNVEAIEVFMMDFLEKARKDGWYWSYLIPSKCLTVNEVSEAICHHLKHVFKMYKELSKSNTKSNVQAHKEHLTKVSQSTRKGLVQYSTCLCHIYH